MADKRTVNGSDRLAAITTSDTVNIPEVPRAIFVSVSGTVTVVGSDDVAVSLGTLPIGVYPVQPKRINAAGTSATVVALY